MLKRIHRALSAPSRRRLPLLFNLTALLSVVLCLGICLAFYEGPVMWPVQPTISRLALSSAGYPLFVTGFTLLSTLLVAALVCRAANIDAQLMSRPARVVNRLWLGMAMLSVLFTLLMAFNRADGTLAWLHFASAGFGMALICLSGILHASLCCCSFAVDRGLACRAPLYASQACGFVGAAVCFGLWFVRHISDTSNNSLQWIGVLLMGRTWGRQ